jgi:hypothetical protein
MTRALGYKRILRIGIPILLVPVLACGAAFRTGHLEGIRQWPLSSDDARSIAISISGLDRRRYDYSDYEEIILRAYKESGLFSEVVLDGDMQELKAEIEITVASERAQAATFLTEQLLTLYLIPRRFVWREITITTRVSSSEKGAIVITKSDVVEDWSQLFLTFVLLFKGNVLYKTCPSRKLVPLEIVEHFSPL